MSEKANELKTMNLENVAIVTNEVDSLTSIDTKVINSEMTKEDINQLEVEGKEIDFKDIDIPDSKRRNSRSRIRNLREKKSRVKEVKEYKEIINDENIRKFHEGSNYTAQEMLGAHVTVENGVNGVRFTTWAPNAKYIYVAGDFNDFKLK